MTTLLVMILTCAALAGTVRAQSYELSSPDASIAVSITLENGAPSYSVTRFGREVIRPSRLGFILHDAAPLTRDFRVVSDERRSLDEVWTQPWGEKKDIRNHFNELRLALEQPDGRRMDLVFRAFDEGVGFRYEIPEQPSLETFEILDELTEFDLAGDHDSWWIPAYADNRYEYLYTETKLSEIDTVHTPVTFETDDGLFVSLHEAALTDYSSMTLAPKGGTTLEADLVPWSDGVRVKTQAPMKTPWRTIQIGDEPGDLVTSYMILNLNEPNALGDVSWIDPGKYVGIWWELHLNESTWGSGPRHGATTENVKQYIDFAAEHGFEGVLVEGWNRGWDGDWTVHGDKFSFTEPYPDFDLEELAAYAREKGVSLIGHHETGAAVTNYAEQMEDAYALYERLGVKGVKSGYVGHGRTIERINDEGERVREWHHGQYMVEHYREALETAARHKIMLNVHEPIKDTGIRRTYPNMMTREGARGQEFDAWSADGGNPPDHTLILPFTRLLSGPMDFTPGTFDLLYEEARPNNRVNTTLAKQLALYVVIYSPLHMASDLPENYEARPGPFQFIKDVPTDWEDTRVLDGRIGDYITVVRRERGTDEWFLGSITDEHGRKLEAPLSFLPQGRTYVAEIYRDGAEADWESNPYPIEIESKLVDASTILPLRLAPGGGQAVHFRPATAEEERALGAVVSP